MKSSIFWDITPCSLLKVIRRFGGTCHPNLKGRRINPARNKRESSWQAELAGFLLGLFFDTDDGGDMFFFVGWDLRHQVLRPLLAYCTAPDDR
jgi:hypothetical protein